MTLRLLSRFAEKGFPYRSADQTEILHIDLLEAAGLISADLPPNVAGKYQGQAVVHSITDMGRTIERSIRDTGRFL